MAIGDKIKRYFDKGVEASKTAFDKGMEASKTALNKASNAVQDFSDKSVVRIEKHQFETKKEEQLLALGKKVFEKFFAHCRKNTSIYSKFLHLPVLQQKLLCFLSIR